MSAARLLVVAALLTACSDTPTTAPAPTMVALASVGGNALNAQACQQNGWQGLVTSDGAPFSGQGECVSYGAQGGTLFRTQTITLTSTAPASAVQGGPTYTPTATATSGLPVAITVDGTSVGCDIASGVVSFTGAGVCVINANQAGNATWYPAAQQQQSFAVSSACPSTLPTPTRTVNRTLTVDAPNTNGSATDVVFDGRQGPTATVIGVNNVSTCAPLNVVGRYTRGVFSPNGDVTWQMKEEDILVGYVRTATTSTLIRDGLIVTDRYALHVADGTETVLWSFTLVITIRPTVVSVP